MINHNPARLLVVAFILFGMASNASSVLAQDSPWAEGQEVEVTRYTYLPGGLVRATTTYETIERSRNPLNSVHFISSQGGIIRPKSAQDRAMRIDAAKEIEGLGYNADWRYFTFQDLTSITLRIRKANELKASGVKVDWHDHQAWQLLEMLDVLNLERELAELGVTLNPKTTDVSTLRDALARVRKARDLGSRGVSVDWREHSFESLCELESKKTRS